MHTSRNTFLADMHGQVDDKRVELSGAYHDKTKINSSVLLFILILAFLVLPVAADLTIIDGGKITTTDGVTSSGITIMGPEISKDGTITIDVSDLNAYLTSGSLTDSNVQVISYTAAIWTADR